MASTDSDAVFGQLNTAAQWLGLAVGVGYALWVIGLAVIATGREPRKVWLVPLAVLAAPLIVAMAWAVVMYVKPVLYLLAVVLPVVVARGIFQFIWSLPRRRQRPPPRS